MATQQEIALKLKITGTTEAGKSLSELKKEFKEEQKLLEGLQAGSKEYVAQLKKVAGIRDDIGDLNDQINSLSSKGKQLESFGKVANGIAGGFSAATGAAALFGGQSQEVEQALLKVQSALAIQQGISAILELGDAFKVLKTVILANPLFLIASVIAGVITYFVGLEDIIDGVKAGFNAMGEAAVAVWDAIVEGIKFAIDIYTQYLDLLTFGLFDLNGAYKDYIENIEAANEAERKRLEGLKKEGEAISENIKAINDQIKATKEAYKAVEERERLVTRAYDKEIALANAAGKNTMQLEKDKLEFVRKSVEEKIQLQIKEFELTQKLSEEVLALQRNQVAQGNKANAELLKAAGKAAEDQKKENKKVLDELKLQLDDLNTAIEVKEIEAQQEAAERWKEAQEAKTAQLEKELQARQKLEEEYARMDLEFKKQIEAELQKSREEARQVEVDINFDALEQNVKQTEDAAMKETEILSAQWNKDNENYANAQEQRINLLSSTLDTLSSITELFGKDNEKNAEKAFKIQKALSIASTLIQTYQSAQAAYLSQLSIPTPDAPIRAAVAAGIAIAAGLAQVAKIASTQYQSSGGGSASASGSAPSISAPSTGSNNQINTTLLDREGIESGQQSEPIQVYVTETDISQTQRRVRGIENRAIVR